MLDDGAKLEGMSYRVKGDGGLKRLGGWPVVMHRAEVAAGSEALRYAECATHVTVFSGMWRWHIHCAALLVHRCVGDMSCQLVLPALSFVSHDLLECLAFGFFRLGALLALQPNIITCGCGSV